MPKLKDLNIVVLYNDINVHFQTPINVTKEGLFTTTLPKDVIATLSEYGAEFTHNRAGNPGYFCSKELSKLESEIEAFVRDCISREVIEEKLVIKYQIKTRCSYIIDEDGEVVPNGGWVKDRSAFDENRVKWSNGTEYHGMDHYTPSLSVFAKIYKKTTYQYKSGKTLVKYEQYKTENTVRGGNVDWLCGQIRVCPEGGFRPYGMKADDMLNRLPEVEATEENAGVFVQMIKLIDKANELFSKLANPELFLAFVKENSLNQIQEKIK